MRRIEIDREEMILEERDNPVDQGGGTEGEMGDPPGGGEEEEGPERRQEEEQGGGREERWLRRGERVDYSAFF